MKLKLFFLGMFAAAFFMSCNNEIGGPNDDATGGIRESKGIPTYFAMNLPPRVGTYAGEDLLSGIPDESNIGNIAVFIYKMDIAQNTFPENYAFITSSSTPVIMKTTDGTKKVYVALNVGPASPSGSTFFGSFMSDATDVTFPEEGDAHTASFNQLNRVIWTDVPASTTGWITTPPAAGLEEGSANGLIRAFAGGTSTLAQGLLYTNTAITALATRFYLMSNWDNGNPDTLYTGSTDYVSTCQFDFDPDVPKTDLLGGGASTAHPKNTRTVNVQRAVAKATMKFLPSADLVVHTNGIAYYTDGDDDDKGLFTPWNATTTAPGNKGTFAAGNINKESTVFQKFTSGSVSDDNYGYINCDPGLTTPPANLNWYANFDNTRVFGFGMKYRDYVTSPSNLLTVTDTRDAMNLGYGTPTANGQQLGADTVYLTENAQEFAPAYQDNSTFLVVGGQYAPRKWVSNVVQQAVVSNTPVIYYNQTPVPGTPPLPGDVIYDPALAYANVPYTTGDDTLYYDIVNKIFFFGKETLEKYYAWIWKKDGFSPAGQSTFPWSTAVAADLTDAINADIAAKTLVAYFRGNCYYRVFITDYKAPIMNERVLVRRNHIYDVNITKILGPGIADPNDIIIPGKPVLPADTYIEIFINIQDWHRVEQDEIVTGE